MSYSFAFFPEDYEKFDFGSVVEMKAIKDDPDAFADIFSEGSPALKDLLKYLWEKDIQTIGCCVGHEDVHYYSKDTVFGKTKYIDEATYLKHADSDRYHHIKTETRAYLGIRCGVLGDDQTLCQKLGDAMSKQIPDLPFCAHIGPQVVSFHLEEYVDTPKRERFFKALSEAFQREIFHERPELAKNAENHPSSQTKPLKDLISSAATKTAAQTPSAPEKTFTPDISR